MSNLTLLAPALEESRVRLRVVVTQTTSATLSVADSGKAITNAGATANITYTLPPAVVGRWYEVRNATDTYTLTVAPNGSDRIGAQGAGETIVLPRRGVVVLECQTLSRWEITTRQEDAPTSISYLTADTNLAGVSVPAPTYSNRDATTAITLTLPTATRGKRITVLKESAYDFDVDCQATDRFSDYGFGVDLSMVDNGFCVFECFIDGVWAIVTHRGTYFADAVANRNIYLSPSGSDSNNGLTAGTPKATLLGIKKIARPGDIVNVAPGTYTGTANEIVTENLPMGTESHRIKFTCSTAFGASFPKFELLYGAFSDVPKYRWYLDLENLVIVGNAMKRIQAYDMRFFRCAFVGGPTSGNFQTVVIGGGNDYYRGAGRVLLEDCVATGPGGRYTFLVYNAEDVILRRCISRWDQGWEPSGGLQAGGFGLYDSTRCELQNCLDIDSLAPTVDPTVWKGSLWIEQNYYDADCLRMVGCLVVNNNGAGIQVNSLATNPVSSPTSGTNVPGGGWNVNRKMRAQNWVLEDIAVGGYANPSYFCYGLNIAGGVDVDVQNITIADSRRTSAVDFYVSPNTRWTGNVRVRNCVSARGAAGGTGHYSLPTHVVATGNLSYSSLVNAKTAGLWHLPRPDVGSTIDAGYAGASIVKRIGANGSLYGEPSYRRIGDGTTASDLWPWPYQSNIKTFLSWVDSTYNIAARGLTASQLTLTQYIWGILGNPGPP
jgi:hypothetical protein